ncbi:hypothetical protein HYFRA_00014161 [Hymenoscyphus fraxineus]|uniref:BTB domain-containing protein n=1 Tax=Hymenoscyphus fraxineus TaxID=746836 RepID=A0A9N9LB29_9HELO|nr:hypothetical protein HYFRA_00014161 [Hymenoscyphus fraxineus]
MDATQTPTTNSGNATPTTITLQLPDMGAIDVQIVVFGQEFNVQSARLKLHSPFFRSSINWPGRSETDCAVAFRLRYTSVTEEDGTWSLQDTSRVNDTAASQHPLNGDTETEIEAFYLVLAAIYDHPLAINTVDGLVSAVGLADYYGLDEKMFPSWVSSVLAQSHNLQACIHRDCKVLLPVAAQLKNAVLFRECVVHIAGAHWRRPEEVWEEFEAWKVKRLIWIACGRINDKIRKLQGLYHYDHLCSRLREAVPSGHLDPEKRLPEFLYALHYNHCALHRSLFVYAHDLMEELLTNNLKLHGKDMVVGKNEDLLDTFLCAEVEDQDLPWNTAQGK